MANSPGKRFDIHLFQEDLASSKSPNSREKSTPAAAGSGGGAAIVSSFTDLWSKQSFNTGAGIVRSKSVFKQNQFQHHRESFTRP